jgi:hypothetical protein
MLMADPYFPQLRGDYEERKLNNGGDSNVFFRYFENKVPGTPTYPTVMFENLKVIERYDHTAMGSSAFQLFLTLHVAESGGRYSLSVLRAEIDATIWISPRSSYKALAEFKPIYDDFERSGGKESRKEALAVAERYLQGGGHSATNFPGIRAKTMRHELEHVAFAVKQCDNWVYNLTNEAAKYGKEAKPDWTGKERVENLMGVLLGDIGFPYIDIGGQEHKQMAIRDFFFMVGFYEHFELKLGEKSEVAYDAVAAAATDYRLKEAMKQIGESPPWLGG